MRLSLSAVQLDTSIQCRADINTDTVSEYAQGMADGAQFPSIVVFGSAEKCWLGDGWHRVLAAQQLLFEEIEADLRAGGRADALKYALGANAAHGRRRTNADKRRCVEIALREFPSLSSRAIAELCGVSHHTVESVRPEPGGQIAHVERTGQDGKQYPAGRREATSAPSVEPGTDEECESEPLPSSDKTHTLPSDRAWVELWEWRTKHRNLAIFRPVFDVIDELRPTFGRR